MVADLLVVELVADAARRADRLKEVPTDGVYDYTLPQDFSFGDLDDLLGDVYERRGWAREGGGGGRRPRRGAAGGR